MKSKNEEIKVLVADDDPAIVDAIQFILEEEGYTVFATVNGRTVIDMVAQSPDVLLLDIWMSGHDGREICRTLKSKTMTKNTPIVMISANKDGHKMAQDAGADDFLSKPFELNDLLNVVRKYTASA